MHRQLAKCMSRLDEGVRAAKTSDSSEPIRRSPRALCHFQSSVDGMFGHSGSANCDGDSKVGSFAADRSEDEGLTGDSTATRESEAEERSSPATTDHLASRISKQVKDALEPFRSILRGVEENEHRHREKLLAIEKRKLALANNKIQFFTRHGAPSWHSLSPQPQVNSMRNAASAPHQPVKDGAEEKGVSTIPSSRLDGSLQPPKLSSTAAKDKRPDGENLSIANKLLAFPDAGPDKSNEGDHLSEGGHSQSDKDLPKVVACSNVRPCLSDDSNAGDNLKDHIASEGDDSHSVDLPKHDKVEGKGDLEHFRQDWVEKTGTLVSGPPKIVTEDKISDGNEAYVKLSGPGILQEPVLAPLCPPASWESDADILRSTIGEKFVKRGALIAASPSLSEVGLRNLVVDSDNLFGAGTGKDWSVSKLDKVVACSNVTPCLSDDWNAGDKLKDHNVSEGDHCHSVDLPNRDKVERRGDLEHLGFPDKETEDDWVKMVSEEKTSGGAIKLFGQTLPLPVTMTSTEPVTSKRAASGKELNPALAKRGRPLNWTDDETHALLMLKLEAAARGREVTQGATWNVFVSITLKEQHGFDRAPKSCQHQYDTLRKLYDAIRVHDANALGAVDGKLCDAIQVHDANALGTVGGMSYWKMKEEERETLQLPHGFYFGWYVLMESIMWCSYNKVTTADSDECLPSWSPTASAEAGEISDSGLLSNPWRSVHPGNEAQTENNILRSSDVASGVQPGHSTVEPSLDERLKNALGSQTGVQGQHANCVGGKMPNLRFRHGKFKSHGIEEGVRKMSLRKKLFLKISDMENYRTSPDSGITESSVVTSQVSDGNTSQEATMNDNFATEGNCDLELRIGN